ncbi:MAG TPA: hypothetical protein PK583_00965 [Gammaproteobacteria bacterium]|nr:hypothetical protein [Gammaproteobacteria bacterium]HQY22340.1 hypothetical protein [Gammaproteobacteria bacterium]HQZ87775.1 hypothetical protein [Gammaproteobacteria bacterium]HRA42263.1 hypothetical protein [Gammaproteobacteria bacterium]
MKVVNIKKTALLLMFLLILDSVFATEQPSLASIADSLVVGTDAVTRLLHFVSIVVGCFLFIMAFSLFRANRLNPKFVPLERPIIYVFLGIILVALPFYGKIFMPTGSTIDLKIEEERAMGVQSHDIDAPLEWGNDYDH